MVLKRLKEELDRGEVDPELLKKLGWTEKDMQRFAERLERQLASACTAFMKPLIFRC